MNRLSRDLTTAMRIALTGVLALLIGASHLSPVAAQDSATAPVVAEVVEEQPTNPPPPPTTIPTPVPSPTIAPTTPPEPAAPTSEPEASTEPNAETATIAPTEVATEATTPEPVVSYRLDADVICTTVPATISTPLVADCQASATVDAKDAGGQEIGYALTISDPKAPSGWAVRLRSETSEWTTGTLTSRWSTRVQNNDAVTFNEAPRFFVEARPECMASPATLELSISLEVTLDGRPITSPDGSTTHTVTLSPPAVPEPGLAFQGSLDFGQVSLSEDGTGAQADGTIGLDIDGLNATCGTWNIMLSGQPLATANGEIIPGAALRLTAVNGVALPSGPCPITTNCLVTSLTTGPDAEDNASLTLSFELTLPAGTAIGSLQSGITAEAVPED